MAIGAAGRLCELILCAYMIIPAVISEITGPYSISDSLVIKPSMIAIIALNL
jgi:hypothetical protein